MIRGSFNNKKHDVPTIWAQLTKRSIFIKKKQVGHYSCGTDNDGLVVLDTNFTLDNKKKLTFQACLYQQEQESLTISTKSSTQNFKVLIYGKISFI